MSTVLVNGKFIFIIIYLNASFPLRLWSCWLHLIEFFCEASSVLERKCIGDSIEEFGLEELDSSDIGWPGLATVSQNEILPVHLSSDAAVKRNFFASPVTHKI